MRKLISALFVIMIVFASNAQAGEVLNKPDFAFKGQVPCTQTDKDGVTEPMRQLVLSVDGKQAHLAGKIEVPTPGYTAELKDLQVEGRNLMGTLRLTAPDGMSMQVIKALPIDFSFELLPRARLLTLAVDKPFAWGPVQIICLFGVL
jgi:hypothetical protein